jgi:hypothetical protein
LFPYNQSSDYGSDVDMIDKNEKHAGRQTEGDTDALIGATTQDDELLN